jgi:hypothetical protein
MLVRACEVLLSAVFAIRQSRTTVPGLPGQPGEGFGGVGEPQSGVPPQRRQTSVHAEPVLEASQNVLPRERIARNVTAPSWHAFLLRASPLGAP